jgi:hypothetical protein
MGDNKAMLDVMKSLDKKIKSTKKNTPKHVSYLVRFNTTEEDFPKEREELFKAQLSAFMRDNIPMDIPEIAPYKRAPISLEKKTYDNSDNGESVDTHSSVIPPYDPLNVVTVNDMGELPIHGAPSDVYAIINDNDSLWRWADYKSCYELLFGTTNLKTEIHGQIFAFEISNYKTEKINKSIRKKTNTTNETHQSDVIVMPASAAHFSELLADYREGNITAIDYAKSTVETLMRSTAPCVISKDGDIYAGTMECSLGNEYEYRVFTHKPIVNIYTSTIKYNIRIEICPVSVVRKLFNPWKKRHWEFIFTISENDKHKKCPVNTLDAVNLPFNLDKESPFANVVLNEFGRVMYDASRNYHCSVSRTFWECVYDAI